MNWSAGSSVMNRIRSVAASWCSRKCRSVSAISPVPASGFGQNQTAGMSSVGQRAQRGFEVAAIVGFGGHRMLDHHQKRPRHVHLAADAVAVQASR